MAARHRLAQDGACGNPAVKRRSERVYAAGQLVRKKHAAVRSVIYVVGDNAAQHFAAHIGKKAGFAAVFYLIYFSRAGGIHIV